MSMRTLAEAKTQAKTLRLELARQGNEISHAQALELVARQHGARDWNTLHARLAKNLPEPFRFRQRVRGRYLGQPFAGEIVAVSAFGNARFKLSIQLDQPVDVVKFESFSNMRRRVSGVVGLDGRSDRETSDGTPHLIVERSNDDARSA